MIEFIELITQVLSWATIPLAFGCLILMAVKVFPRQYRLYRVSDEYSFERRSLPRLSSSFVTLGILLGAAIAYNTISGLNGHNIYTNITRILVNLMIAHGGYSWTELYLRNERK